MNYDVTDGTERRAVELAQIICEAERELQELTGAQLDAVSDARGSTYLLSGAQEKLRVSEQAQRRAAEILASVMDALPAHIALIDPDGVILMVNQSWKQLATANNLQGPQFGIGDNYLEICESVTGSHAIQAHTGARGVRAVLQGNTPAFSFEYSCHSQTEQRWFRFVATPLDKENLGGAVVMHVDISETKKIEEQLVWKTALLEAQVDASIDGMMIVDCEGMKVLENRRMVDLWNMPPNIAGELNHRARFSWFVSQARNPEAYYERVKHLYAHPDEISRDELELISGKWLDRYSAPVRGRDGKYYGRIWTFRDITERRVAEIALRQSEERLRLITDLVPHGIFAKDAEGRHIFANPALAEMAGLSVEEILGKTDYDLVADAAQAEAYRADDRAVMHSGSRMFISEEPRTDLSGRTRFLQTIKIPFKVPATGEPAVLGICMDITERKRAEEALLRQQTELQVVFDLMPAMLCVKDTENNFLRVNQRLSEAAGRPIAEIEGKSAAEVFPRDANKYYADDLEVIRTGTAKLGIIEKIQQIDGRDMWTQTDKVPVRNREGNVSAIVVMIQDITERKANEEALRYSEGNMAAAQRIAHFGSWELDLANLEDIAANGVRWSDEIFRIAGYEPGEIEPSNAAFFAHVPVEEHAAIHEAMARAIREGGQYSIVHRLIRADGKELVVREVAQVHCDQRTGRPLKIIGTTHDITEQRRVEASLVETSALLESLLQNTTDYIYFKDLQSRFVHFSRAVMRAFRVTHPNEITGRTDFDFFTEEHARPAFESEQEIIRTGKPVLNLEEKVTHLDGRVGWALTSKMPWLDKTGNVIGTMGITRDITEHKNLEIQFFRAQRMESVGTLASGIAHDLNNILSPILMSIDLLKDTAGDSQSALIIHTIEASAKRGAEIVRQVLSFARGVEGERIEIQPKHILLEVENIIRDTFPKDIRIQFSLPSDTWTVLGDPTQIHQILLNLCVNARDAMPNGGSLVIGMENTTLDEHYAAMNLQAKPGNYVNINVTDTGMGIPPALIEKIFEPFFTTKEVGKGTGLGLSTVIAIVKGHEGFVNVYSEPGKGTTFRVYIPAVENPSQVTCHAPEQTTLPRGNGETILLVDDEPSLSIIASSTLESFGYRVLTAADGAEAVAVYLEHRAEVAVVLTDMMMPVMDGPAMIHAMMRINPAVKVIATSGLNANGNLTKVAEMRVKHFLIKPYTAETLLKTLRAILEEK